MSDHRGLRRILTPAVLLVGTGVVWILLSGAPGYIKSLTVLIGVYYLLSSSLNLVIGYTDLISFGHAGFFAIGAYAAVLSAKYWHSGLLVGALLGAVIAGAFAFVVVSASRRLSGVYFALATLAAAEIVHIVLLNWVSFTRGPLGLSLPAVERTLFPGFPLKTSDFIHVVFIAAILVTLGIWLLLRSDVGARMIAVRENAALAASVGISPSRYRIIAFVISGAVAAVAGSIYAFNYGILTPELSGMKYSALPLLMVIFGGRGTLFGPLIGAIIFMLLPEWIDIQGALGEVMFAVILFIVVLVMPRGVIGTIRGELQKRRLAVPATSESKVAVK